MPQAKRKPSNAVLARKLAEIGREFHSRGWAFGTSGNYSAVLERKPLKLLITSSGLDKSALEPRQFLEIDETTKVLKGSGRPSAEAFLHIVVARVHDTGCILHTHSVWSTIVSDRHAARKSLELSGYEMLKGLAGIRTHEHAEQVPIFENSQDIPKLAAEVERRLKAEPGAHGFLLRGHGLYTWGQDAAEARRHVEILEFLLEVAGRRELGEPAGTYA